MRENGSFWDNHSQQGMCFLNAPLLITSHGITVINTHAFNAVNTRFKRYRVAEFTATVSQVLKTDRKSYVPRALSSSLMATLTAPSVQRFRSLAINSCVSGM